MSLSSSLAGTRFWDLSPQQLPSWLRLGQDEWNNYLLDQCSKEQWTLAFSSLSRRKPAPGCSGGRGGSWMGRGDLRLFYNSKRKTIAGASPGRYGTYTPTRFLLSNKQATTRKQRDLCLAQPQKSDTLPQEFPASHWYLRFFTLLWLLLFPLLLRIYVGGTFGRGPALALAWGDTHMAAGVCVCPSTLSST